MEDQATLACSEILEAARFDAVVACRQIAQAEDRLRKIEGGARGDCRFDRERGS
jgi:hypothetical protein